ncbi:conserved hypothetical protein (DUF4163, DUF3298) [Formosa agariphila KMM 3901]|uniref:DUF3298/DUF4163 domain-containing protein n=1 Tax=Formosa agariphila (strain DSM 15362 / KCTC 12365 / LMG 23005 / KMM 3901 / M-2Alg 35-1) TaxID=1347342 RepID=T2KSA3_FORAG|nr:DUF3298 and DUF4163 domain-containing protein [Formosa agariphila]CDF81069.1 conserved hypothetical protein (DUF4163, DUF3298) [Formosa agariphila KMM 3901]
MASCSEEKTITFSEESITTPENTIVDINIPQAVGDNEVALQINTILKQHVSASLQFNQEDQRINAIEDQINSFNTEYTNFKNQFPESAQEWEAQIDGEVMYETPELISISLTSYTNTGGAHGILVITFLNFNGQTGELIETNKLFDDQDEFYEFAKPYFNEEISNKKDLVVDSESFVLPQNIGYSADGLILLYNTYEIAPYAAGITEFIIPFNDANSYLKFDGF